MKMARKDTSVGFDGNKEMCNMRSVENTNCIVIYALGRSSCTSMVSNVREQVNLKYITSHPSCQSKVSGKSVPLYVRSTTVSVILLSLLLLPNSRPFCRIYVEAIKTRLCNRDCKQGNEFR